MAIITDQFEKSKQDLESKTSEIQNVKQLETKERKQRLNWLYFRA